MSDGDSTQSIRNISRMSSHDWCSGGPFPVSKILFGSYHNMFTTKSKVSNLASPTFGGVKLETFDVVLKLFVQYGVPQFNIPL